MCASRDIAHCVYGGGGGEVKVFGKKVEPKGKKRHDFGSEVKRKEVGGGGGRWCGTRKAFMVFNSCS